MTHRKMPNVSRTLLALPVAVRQRSLSCDLSLPSKSKAGSLTSTSIKATGAWLFAIVLATSLAVTGVASAEATVRLKSAYSFSDTLSRLRSTLEVKGFTIFATIDHRSAAQSVGLDMPPTTVLIYGNPKGGTSLMVAAPDFALELPLRVLVREGDDGKTYVVLNPSAELESKHGLPEGMTEKLAPAEKIVADAVAERNTK
jgi:uncharacterized protein (DUF302 family)